MTIEKIVIIIPLLVILSCDPQQNEISSETSAGSIKATIVENFKKYDASYLSPIDSCLYLQYIDKEYDPLNEDTYQVLAGIKIFNERCRDTGFSFSLIENGNGEFYYYGMPDIYLLKYSGKLDRGNVLKFRSEALNSLIKKFPKLDKQGDKVKLKKFLYYLYHERRDDLNKPLLIERGALSEYSEKIDKSQFKNELNLNDDFLVFENFDLGVIIFKIYYSSNGVSVQEYLIPRTDRVRFVDKSDSPAEIPAGCR